MNFYDAIHEIAQGEGLSLEKASLKTGHSGTYISNARSRGSLPTVGNAAMIAAVLGYKLCLVAEGSVPEDAYVIE